MTTRRPHRLHEGRKGFGNPVEPPTQRAKDIDALEKYRTAQRVLQENGSFFPSVQQLLDGNKEAEKLNELQALKERISDLQKHHSNDLERLYKSQAQDYLQEARDRYVAKDDTQYLVKGENNSTAKAAYGRLDSLYKETRRPHSFALEWDDAVDRVRVEHLKRILPLQRRRAELERLEGEARRRRDAQFPGSSDEYHAIRDNDIQLRVARFLAADSQTQESIMTRFGWAWRAVQPLKNEYQINTVFRAEIQEKAKESSAKAARRKAG